MRSVGPVMKRKVCKAMFGKDIQTVWKRKTRKEEFSDWRSELDVDEVCRKLGVIRGMTKTSTKFGTKGKLVVGLIGRFMQ